MKGITNLVVSTATHDMGMARARSHHETNRDELEADGDTPLNIASSRVDESDTVGDPVRTGNQF